MSNFSFSHSVFKRHVWQTCKNKDLFGKGLKWFVKTKKHLQETKWRQTQNNKHKYHMHEVFKRLYDIGTSLQNKKISHLVPTKDTF